PSPLPSSPTSGKHSSSTPSRPAPTSTVPSPLSASTPTSSTLTTPTSRAYPCRRSSQPPSMPNPSRNGIYLITEDVTMEDFCIHVTVSLILSLKSGRAFLLLLFPGH
ncbi:hypothetical protein V8G54_035013, partial [Vigna mungo]